MPLYTFKNKKTQETFEENVSIEQYYKYLEENPDIERFYDRTPMIVSGVGGIKTDEGWKDRLRAIKKANPGSTIDV